MSHAIENLLQQAHQARKDKRLQDARRDLIEAVDLGHKSDVGIELARALAALGQIERDLHNHEAALRNYEKAVAIYRTQGDPLRVAHTIRHVADIHRHQGNWALAERCYHEALDLYREHEHTPQLDLANAIRGLAILKDDSGHVEQAKMLWLEARDLYSAANVEAGVAESSQRLARLS